MNIKLNIDNLLGFISLDEIKSMQSQIDLCHKSLISKSGKGNDFLGWVDLPSEISEELFLKIENDANKLWSNSKVVVVVGIGGSYLGARAVIDSLNHNFASLLNDNKSPIIIYAGNNISEDYHSDLIDVLIKVDYSIVVISKSGTTTEPAIAFRVLKNHIEKKYGKENAKNRIIVITDKSRGALKKVADNEGYSTYVIPDDVGGRYSVLTPVGLIPIAIAGFDIRKLVKGSVDMRKLAISSSSINENPTIMYAVARNVLYNKGYTTEILANYLPNLFYLTEWWKQLYGESEGKENKGIFTAGVNFTTDLHSLGQYIQEGLRNIFETVISVDNSKRELQVPFDNENIDGFNFVAGKRFQYVNKMAELGTALAHVDGKVPNIHISIPELNEEIVGQLIYFFEFACALSGYMLGVNPFDQPGVEAYKNNMFALLGKPGFENKTDEIRKRIK